MADSREIGMRVGASANQAATIVAALLTSGQISVTDVSDFHRDILGICLTNMETASSDLLGQNATPTPQAIPTLPSTPQPAPQYDAAAALQAEMGAVSTDGNVPTITTGKSPFSIDEAGVPAWLKAQASAVGVDKLWDNTTKANYVAAVAAGKEKTPPPYRSATDGVDKAFWPPR